MMNLLWVDDEFALGKGGFFCRIGDSEAFHSLGRMDACVLLADLGVFSKL